MPWNKETKPNKTNQEKLDVVLTKIKNRKSNRPSRNTPRRIEEKEIRWLTAPILQRFI